MIQFNNILYPIDLDSEDNSPVVKALEIAKLFKSRIHILYVNDEAAGFRHPTDREDAVALRVKEIAPEGSLDGIEVTYAVSKGKLEEEVADYCKKHKIDLIITGHRHRSKTYSMLFDSPDVAIIDSINLPILVIPKD